MKLKLIFIALLFRLVAAAQALRQPSSVAFAQTAAYSTNFLDVFSGTSNQAAFAQTKTPSLGVLAERRFMVAELNQYSLVAAAPAGEGVFAFQADYFGFNEYNETQLGLAYARSITASIDVGAKFNFYNAQVAGYGNASAVNFETGAIFHFTDELNGGIHVYNPLSAAIGKHKQNRLPSIYKAGFGFQSSKHLFIGTEIVHEEDMPVSLQVAVQYRIHDKVVLRGGFSTATVNSFAGIGLQAGFVRIDITAAYHQLLGFTPGILLSCNLKKPAAD